MKRVGNFNQFDIVFNMVKNLTKPNRNLDYIKGLKPFSRREKMQKTQIKYVKMTKKKLYIIIDTQQIEGNPLMSHLHIILCTFITNALK